MQMRKTLVTAFALAMLFAAPALFADDASDNYIEISGDAWFTDFNGLSDRLAGVAGYAIPVPVYNMYPAMPYYMGIGNADSPTFLGLDDEDDVAPVIQFNYIRKGKHGFGASYTQAKERDAVALVDFNDPLYPATLEPTFWTDFLLGFPLIATDVTADFGAELTEWSVHYIRVLNRDNDDSQWRALLGWSVIDYEQADIQRWGWVFDPVDYMYLATGESDIGANGPMIGLAGSQRLGTVEGLRFHGAASFAYLSGTAHAKRTEIYDPQGFFIGPMQIYSVSRDTDETVTKMNLSLGLSYTFNFGLEIRGGYRLSRWANLPNAPIVNAAANAEDRDRDVSLEGFYTGLGWRWGWGR
jgi:opacity protein-like surface antigen